jgi:hypothetical protein
MDKDTRTAWFGEEVISPSVTTFTDPEMELLRALIVATYRLPIGLPYSAKMHSVGQAVVDSMWAKLAVETDDVGAASKPSHGKNHTLTGRGVLWVLLELSADLAEEIACEVGVRRCHAECPGWKRLWQEMKAYR